MTFFFRMVDCDDSFENTAFHTVRWILQNHSKKIMKLLTSHNSAGKMAALHLMEGMLIILL